MNENQIVRAWKDSSFRATLSDAQLAALPASPVGARMVEIDEDRLQNVGGACGWICSLTADCSGTTASRVLRCGSFV